MFITTRSDGAPPPGAPLDDDEDRKSTRLNSSHLVKSYAVFCLKKKTYNRDYPLSHTSVFENRYSETTSTTIVDLLSTHETHLHACLSYHATATDVQVEL